ncbi:hypothetical protein R8Z50_22895 [Longispora sp. K20-0274]|uniref:hypothetical protein n=1 Tax=Longispora sp. K20-0274 TaxID=3088255 RepID=UPI00399BF52B
MQRDIGRSYSAALLFVGPLDPGLTAKILRIALAALAAEGVDVLGASVTYDTSKSCDHTLIVTCAEPGCLHAPGHGGEHTPLASAPRRAPEPHPVGHPANETFTTQGACT